MTDSFINKKVVSKTGVFGTEKRDLIEIMQDLQHHAKTEGITPLIIEYQTLMGQFRQDHYYCVGLMYAKYMAGEEK